MIEIQPELRALAPAGLYLAFRLRIAYPAEEINDLPEAWVQYYTRKTFVIDDPLIRWAHFNKGASRWIDVMEEDRRGIISAARKFGMAYGAVASVRCPITRLMSYILVARNDRAYTDEELALIEKCLIQLHETDLPSGTPMTQAELLALRLLQSGMKTKTMSAELGISESAVKQRLLSARKKIGGKTSAHAAQLAADAKLI